MSTRRHLPRVSASLVIVTAGIISLIGLLLVARSFLGHSASASPAPSSLSAQSGQVKVPSAAYTPDAPILSRHGWSASASDQLAGHPADAVLDSNAFSYWDSQGLMSQTGTLAVDHHRHAGHPRSCRALSMSPVRAPARSGRSAGSRSASVLTASTSRPSPPGRGPTPPPSSKSASLR